MKEVTRTMLTATLQSDETITLEHRNKIMQAINNEPLPVETLPQVVTFDRAAQLTSLTKRSLFKYCNRGIFTRVKAAGGRTIGITEKSMRAFLEGTTAPSRRRNR